MWYCARDPQKLALAKHEVEDMLEPVPRARSIALAPSHGENRGSSPLGSANKFKSYVMATLSVPEVSRLCEAIVLAQLDRELPSREPLSIGSRARTHLFWLEARRISRGPSAGDERTDDAQNGGQDKSRGSLGPGCRNLAITPGKRREHASPIDRRGPSHRHGPSLLHLWEKHFVHVRGPAGEPISRGPTHDLRQNPSL